MPEETLSWTLEAAPFSWSAIVGVVVLVGVLGVAGDTVGSLDCFRMGRSVNSLSLCLIDRDEF